MPSHTISRENSIVREDDGAMENYAHVLVPDEWADELNAYRRARWNEGRGHGIGSAEIETGTEAERMAQTIWVAAGGGDANTLIWVEGHGGALVAYLTINAATGRYQFRA